MSGNKFEHARGDNNATGSRSRFELGQGIKRWLFVGILGCLAFTTGISAQTPALTLGTDGFDEQGFVVLVKGEDGQVIQVEVSEDLDTWTELLSPTTLENGEVRVVDSEAVVHPRRCFAPLHVDH